MFQLFPTIFLFSDLKSVFNWWCVEQKIFPAAFSNSLLGPRPDERGERYLGSNTAIFLWPGHPLYLRIGGFEGFF